MLYMSEELQGRQAQSGARGILLGSMQAGIVRKFRDCAGVYHSFKIDILREWNLLYLNKTSFPFSCEIHSTCKICLINSVNFVSLKDQLGNKKVKILKAMKSRARRMQQVVRELPENMADVIDELNTSSKSATCMTDLSFNRRVSY